MAMPFKSIRQTSCDVNQHVTTASHFTMTPRVVIFSSKLPEAPAASPSSARLCTSVAASSTRGLRSPQPSLHVGVFSSTIIQQLRQAGETGFHVHVYRHSIVDGTSTSPSVAPGLCVAQQSSHSQVLSRIRPGAAARQFTVAVLPWVCHVQMRHP